jgi:APA family basic amino acid/polyamine antiporter
MGLVHSSEFANDAKPSAATFCKKGYGLLQNGFLVAISSGYTSAMMGQTRVFLLRGKDYFLSNLFGGIHAKIHSPWKANLFFTVFVNLFAGFVSVSDLGHMVSTGTLLAFSLICVGVWILRVKGPELKNSL